PNPISLSSSEPCRRAPYPLSLPLNAQLPPATAPHVSSVKPIALGDQVSVIVWDDANDKVASAQRCFPQFAKPVRVNDSEAKGIRLGYPFPVSPDFLSQRTWTFL